jgi:hypothetical protein
LSAPVLESNSPPGDGEAASAIVAASLPVSGVDAGPHVSSPQNPAALPRPNLANAVPADCRGAVDRAKPFEATAAGAVALVFVVTCDATHSLGPLVYVSGLTGWRLLAQGPIHSGYAYDAFSGGMSGQSADEFGIAWTSGDGTTSTLTLYRIEPAGPRSFWDSRDADLSWSFPQLSYEASPDSATSGVLAVISTDLSTGTANCPACPDHVKYRDTYSWDPHAATPGLRRLSHDLYPSP